MTTFGPVPRPTKVAATLAVHLQSAPIAFGRTPPSRDETSTRPPSQN
jgi:hypothetical protein